MTVQKTGRQKSEARRQIVITNPAVCFYCKSTGLTDADNFCPNCGFPQRGSQPAMKRFIWNVNNKHTLLADQKKAIRKARSILFGLPVFFVVFGIIFSFTEEQGMLILISNLVIAAVYLGLGFWSRKNPFPAILTGFFIYITLIVIAAVNNPASLFQGLLVKGFIIAGFVYGYKGVKDSEALEKELESIKKAKDFTPSDEVSVVSS